MIDDSDSFDNLNNPITWKERGNELFNKGEYQKAIECFAQAIELDPNYLDAWNNLGYTLLKMGKIEEAKSINKKIKELKNKSVKDIPPSSNIDRSSPKEPLKSPLIIDKEGLRRKYENGEISYDEYQEHFQGKDVPEIENSKKIESLISSDLKSEEYLRGIISSTTLMKENVDGKITKGYGLLVTNHRLIGINEPTPFFKKLAVSSAVGVSFSDDVIQHFNEKKPIDFNEKLRDIDFELRNDDIKIIELKQPPYAFFLEMFLGHLIAKSATNDKITLKIRTYNDYKKILALMKECYPEKLKVIK
jgi:tetratricopeptide (TPR) repeat protein